MDLTAFDAFRYAMLAFFGLGCALMVVINVIAFKVLRPPKGIGFLWWHIVAISTSFACFGAVAMDRVVGQLGEIPSWRTWATLLGTASFLAAMCIIFNVEKDRLALRRAQELVDAHPDLVLDPATGNMVPAPYAGYDDER